MPKKTIKERLNKLNKPKTKEDATMSVLDMLHGEVPTNKEEEEDEIKKPRKRRKIPSRPKGVY